jgi:hypothetical protein
LKTLTDTGTKKGGAYIGYLGLAYSKEGFFMDAMRSAGELHNKTHKTENPAVGPYYGEIPYSGRYNAKGYYGSQFKYYMDKHGRSALYGRFLATHWIPSKK